MAITTDMKTNFDTLVEAVKDGNVALLECKDSRTGKVVYCLTAMCSDGTMVPFARMHDLEDLNTLQPPNPDGGFYEACEWSPE